MDNPKQTINSQWDSFFSLGAPAPGSERFTSLSGTRYDLWKVSADQFEGHPLGGVGAGNFATTYYKQRSTDENARQPHSLVMQVVGELGLGGVLLLAAFLGAIAVAIFRRGHASLARMDRRLLVGSGGAFMVWFAHTSIDWLHILPGITAIALICAALLLVTPEGRSQAEDWFDRAGMIRTGLLLVSVVLIALLAMSTGRQYAGERYRKAGQEVLAEDPQSALEKADTALDLNSGDMRAYYLKAAAYARLDDYESTQATLLEAARHEPSNSAPWALLGDATIRSGDVERARAYYEEGLERNPRDPQLQDLVEDPHRALAR
jgi:tetratricopeptide (TPR) repeat protein